MISNNHAVSHDSSATANSISKLEEHYRKMDAAFEHDDKLGYITIKVAYPYHIELARIANKANLLEWALHLCHKTWMDTEHLAEFIERVCKIKGWKHESL